MPEEPDTETGPSTDRKELQKRETDRKYVKFKSKQVKKEHNRGNKAAADRHARELLQYLGLDGEMPVEGMIRSLEETDATPFEKATRLQQLRNTSSDTNSN